MKKSMIIGSVSLALVVAGSSVLSATALAQSSRTGTRARIPVDPRARTLSKMMKPITIQLDRQRLEDVIAFIGEVSGAPLEPLWIDDRNTNGLDPDMEVTIQVENRTLLALLERVLKRAETDAFTTNTWQLTEAGTLEFGPKSRLNLSKRLEIYPIDDLLYVIPDFLDAPTLDLDSVLNQSDGGSGGSIFQDEQGDPARQDPASQAQEIIDIMTSVIEPDEWIDNGGDGASVRFYNNSLLVNAPDYIHRQINGYPFWPHTDSVSFRTGRYVPLTPGGSGTATATGGGTTSTTTTQSGGK